MNSFLFDGLTAIIPFPTNFPLNCEACNQQIRESTYKRDIFRHSKKCRQRSPDAAPADELVFECIYCNFWAADRRKATTHQATHFGEENYVLPSYPCDCNRKFATQKALSSHQVRCPSAKRSSEHRLVQNADTIRDIQNANTSPFLPPRSSSHREETHAEPGNHVQDEPLPSPRSSSPAGENHTELCYSFVSTNSLPDNEHDIYPVVPPDTPVEIDQAFATLIPAKPEAAKREAPKSTFRITAAALQKLYTTNSKRAMAKIQMLPTINCEVDPVDLRFGLLQQLETKGIDIPQDRLWTRCKEGVDILSAPFNETEINEALKHPDTAPGPDGWKYRELSKIDNFVPRFLELLHRMAAIGETPDVWRRYNTMLLFKKPSEYVPGQEKVLKNFRPIALSNVSYKLLAAILCKRLSKWLEANKGISYSQRAVFSRRGVQENTLTVAEALRAKKTVIYLDLSDAFNTAEHPLLLEALKQSGCPKWIMDIIASVYRHCITSPVDLFGKKLAGDVPVSRGVRQGCPLSSLLFNLVLDPVLQAASGPGSLCLGYMDDIAIIVDNPENVPQTLSRTAEVAQSLGFSFNISKCGIANYSKEVMINASPIPKVTDSRAYKYLGTETFPNTIGGLDACLQTTWELAEKIEVSELTPMQKIHAVRTKVLPMMYHLVENSYTTQDKLYDINRRLRKLTKRLCYLPERATNAYIHLDRMYGGPGMPDFVVMKARLTLQTFIRAINLGDEFGEKVRTLIQKNLSSSELIQKINSGCKSGLSLLGKEVSMAMTRIEKYLGCNLRLDLHESGNVVLYINNMIYKDPNPTLKLLIRKQGLKNLCNATNQGRFWKSLSTNPAATKLVYSFHTKMCDWRHAHSARLNLTPLKASFNWSHRRDEACRRCQTGRETLNHVLNNCPAQRRDIIQRHNNIRDTLIDKLPKHLKVFREQRFGNLQPDMIVEDSRKNEAYILDVKVSSEDTNLFAENQHRMKEKYEPLRRAYEIRGTQATTSTIQLGCLGSISRSTSETIHRLLGNRREARRLMVQLSCQASHAARNLTVQFLSGQKQNM